MISIILLSTAAIYTPQLTDSIPDKYSWHPDGLIIYAAPSLTADSINRAGYGEFILVEELLDGETVNVALYQHDEDKWISDEYLKLYQHASHWLRIKHGGRSGFILDTYLAPIPPLDTSHKSGLVWEEYLKSLSVVTFEKCEGQTEDFCARNTLHFENGIVYTYTDFGPCEQCGHVQTQLYVPLIGKAEAMMMGLHFFRCYGLFSGANSVLLKREGEGVALEGYMESGQTLVISFTELRDGVCLIEDNYF
ncbi:hypothetical protein JHJ32_08440 [Parapedobacter sp. ISTM3]|uniref:hypothetical protein n=1 Tax=Parapedobacter sp. ISTM3 TaxID=2800130 RepID=UPI00190566DB|nr:hypothetical protein [Parapedobacter sp. ISTM3]MBK1440010.1 hypothetical protein [Parapedobacter sp. ISTM3]